MENTARNRSRTPEACVPQFRYEDAAILFLRIFVGVLMLLHGIYKTQNYNMLAGSFPEVFGLSSAVSLVLITLAEVGCSALLIIGLFTRIAAIGLAFGMFTAAVVVPAHITAASSELPFVYMGIYIFLLISGGGKYALDAMFFPTIRKIRSDRSSLRTR